MTQAPRSSTPSRYRHGCDPPTNERTITPASLDNSTTGFVPVYPATRIAYRPRTASFIIGYSTTTTGFLAEQIVRSEPPRKRNSRQFALRCWLSAISCSLLVALAGCGPTSSDNAPNLGSRASVGGPVTRVAGQGGKIVAPILPSENQTVSTQAGGAVLEGDNIRQDGKPASRSDSPHADDAEAQDKTPAPGIPDAIAKDLASPDARVRLQAMNHWEAQGTKAPLDPLFEALDDEDGYVRAKATEIIERYWVIEQEQERNRIGGQ